jgi:hypothetical protein
MSVASFARPALVAAGLALPCARRRDRQQLPSTSKQTKCLSCVECFAYLLVATSAVAPQLKVPGTSGVVLLLSECIYIYTHTARQVCSMQQITGPCYFLQ